MSHDKISDAIDHIRATTFVEASWFKSGHSGDVTGLLPPVVCLSFCRWSPTIKKT
jgi:hypothetical protein